MTLNDSLPAVYRGFLPEVFRREVPAETKATCASCAMCAGTSADAIDKPARLFDARTKCCTYHPRLPNFLVGGLLADARPGFAEGQRRVRAKIAAREGVTPLWVSPPAKYQFLYNHMRDAFGRSPSLLCPFYEDAGGGCTIWAYRESVCSTFFCRYVAGADGMKMWMTLKGYLSLVEAQLSRWLLLQLDPGLIYEMPDDPPRGLGERLTLEELDGHAPDDAWYARAWRGFAGREEALFIACYEKALTLTPEDLAKILGLDGEIARERCERTMAKALGTALPATLALNPAVTVRHLADGSVALGAYSEFDGVALPREAYDLLAEFRAGETLSAVRQRLRDDKGTDFADEILLTLHQHRILI